jgi:hypothetical protein
MFSKSSYPSAREIPPEVRGQVQQSSFAIHPVGGQGGEIHFTDLEPIKAYPAETRIPPAANLSRLPPGGRCA